MADTSIDEEKGMRTQPANTDGFLSSEYAFAVPAQSPARSNPFERLNNKILSIEFLERRSFERVPVEERHEITASRYMQMMLLWFSSNITANNIAVGMLGPLAYNLGFTDSALCAAFGAALGAAGSAYMSTLGPHSGNRTMVS
jgi:hypothetical protein